MKTKLLLFLAVSLVFLSNSSNAQFRNYNVKGGAQYVQVLPLTEFDAAYSFIGRGYLAFELSKILGLEIGAGYGNYMTEDNFNTHSDSNSSSHGHNVEANIIPIDARLRIAPWAPTAKEWNPYFYLGAGLMNYNVKILPTTINIPEYQEKDKGWTGTIPIGIGTEVKLGSNVLLDISGGAAYAFTDQLNNFVLGEWEDSYANLALGLTFAGNDQSKMDDDRDGLINMREEELGTNPNNPDTDGDGLKDGPEVDTYKTNPLNKDTDGDKLNDYEEVISYTTNPLNVDTDSDKLNDYDELRTYSTLPKDSDTDDDELIDGDEVQKYKTDPKEFDTDHGTVKDGVEVNRGTDPLNPNDDLPPAPKEEPMKVGAVIVLEGINFESGSYAISSGSEATLEQAYNTLKNNPEIVVEISGHTDNRGGRAMNMTLSQNRAEAVKEWLVAKGISASRITAVGFGPDQPVASNDTPEGRLQNRRIEFKRIQ